MQERTEPVSVENIKTSTKEEERKEIDKDLIIKASNNDVTERKEKKKKKKSKKGDRIKTKRDGNGSNEFLIDGADSHDASNNVYKDENGSNLDMSDKVETDEPKLENSKDIDLDEHAVKVGANTDSLRAGSSATNKISVPGTSNLGKFSDDDTIVGYTNFHTGFELLRNIPVYGKNKQKSFDPIQFHKDLERRGFERLKDEFKFDFRLNTSKLTFVTDCGIFEFEKSKEYSRGRFRIPSEEVKQYMKQFSIKETQLACYCKHGTQILKIYVEGLLLNRIVLVIKLAKCINNGCPTNYDFERDLIYEHMVGIPDTLITPEFLVELN